MGNWNGRGLAVGSLLLVAGLLYLLTQLTAGPAARPAWQRTAESGELFVYCAASIKPAIAEAAESFAREPFGVPVRLQYGGSGTLLNNLTIARKGDLYIAADESYLDLAIQRGVVTESFGLARMRPVLAVARGNPLDVSGLEDLARQDLRVGLANPDAASIGKLTRTLLEAEGLWDRVEANVAVLKPTVSDVANDVMMGALDVTVIWDVVAAQHADHLDTVRVPAFDNAVQQVSLGILRDSKQPMVALRFVRYLQSTDQGHSVFQRHHYEPVSFEPDDPVGRSFLPTTP